MRRWSNLRSKYYVSESNSITIDWGAWTCFSCDYNRLGLCLLQKKKMRKLISCLIGFFLVLGLASAEGFDAMNLTKGEDYICDPVNCKSYYVSHSGATGKGISLDDDEDLYGFKIKENKLIRSVEDLEFNVDVFANASCYNQVFIDLFNDGSVDFYNNKPYKGSLGNCGDTFY